MTSRKILYVTGTRADYGLMREILLGLDAAVGVELSLCVTGMHLSALYGETVREIEADNLRICGRIVVDVDSATHVAMAQSIGHGILAMTEVFAREQPDLILLLGDRGEMLAAAITAIHLNIPVVHLHGGERSGTADEMVRHAISKFSHYHFVATQQSKERLVKMGERADNVFVTGAPGLDQIHCFQASTREVFYARYALDANKKTALLIYHPVVQESQDIQAQFQQLMQAGLDADLQLICLEPNSDAGGYLIREALQAFATLPQVRIIKHLERASFLDCLSQVDVMLGNSSSGIIEAASFNKVVVNVGSRQNLREQSDNVINTEASYASIAQGLQEALMRPKRSYTNVYGDGKASARCCALLQTLTLHAELLNKCNVY